MQKYYGVLKRKSQAIEWAEKLESGTTAEQKDAGKMLRNNWAYIASRPELAIRVFALVETLPLDAERKGSVVNRILSKGGKYE